MKLAFALLGLLGAGLALILLAPHAAATTNCSSGNVCKGWAQVSTTTGGVASTRCFSLRTTNTAPACATTTANEATWEMVAGSCVTAYYFDTTTGAVPPAAPNKIGISLRLDNTATIIHTYQNNVGPEPANGATTSFCATSDGTASGTARAGTYRIYLRAIKDDAPGGVGNYQVDSDGVAAVGVITTFDSGALRGRMLVSSIGRSAYPADATFAYGTAGNEQVTITAAYTQPNGGSPQARDGIFDAATHVVGPSGASTNVGGTTSLAQAFTIDSTLPQANSPYQPWFAISSNSGLLGEAWTVFAATGHGSNIALYSNVVAYDTTTFNIDPRIVLDSDGVGTFATADDMWLNKLTNSGGAVVTSYNRGETAYTEGYIFNARAEKLSRAMTVTTEDAGALTCTSLGSLTPTSNKYSTTWTIPTGGSCTVANTDPGSARYIRATNTNQNHLGVLDFYVSSLYYIDAHIQLSATLNKDDFPTQNANEDTAYIISTAITDTTHGWCHIKSVRKDVEIDTSGSVITWGYIDPASAVRFVGTTDTGSDGWTATHLDLLASTPLGTWTFRCTSAAFNGNTGTNDQAFTVSVPSGGGGFPGDPLRMLCAPVIANPGETITCVASENNLDGSARTGNTAGTLYDIWNPSNSAITTGGALTEIGTTGNYRFTYSPGGSPALGNYIVVVRTTDASPVSTSTVFTIETDPTVALASSLATALVDTGLIKGYTDTVEASLATAATQVSGVATQVSTHETNAAFYHFNETQEIHEVHDDAHEAIALLQGLNLTITGNFTFDNATLQSILENITAHRADPLELNGMPLETTSQLTSILPILIAFLTTAFLLRFPAWVAPGGILVGFGVFFLAFRQTVPALVWCQAAAGLLLVGFSVFGLAYNFYKRPKQEKRRFFDE